MEGVDGCCSVVVLSEPGGVRLPACRCSAWKGTGNLRQSIIFNYLVYSFTYCYHYFYCFFKGGLIFTLIFSVREFGVKGKDRFIF